MEELTKEEKTSLICAIDSKIITLKHKLQEIPPHNLPRVEILQEIKAELSRLENLRKKLF